MRHHVEIDQSIKIEQTQGDTVLAFSNDISQVLLIPASVKRACQRALRARNVRPGMVVLRIFAAGLVLLLAEHVDQIAGITIDTEYVGKEGEIKGLLLRFLAEWNPALNKDAITFRRIGKRSRAHALAWETRRGLRSPDKRATLEDLLRYC